MFSTSTGYSVNEYSSILEDTDADYENNTKGKSSVVRAGANMTKSFIGAASFELPWAVMQAGLLGGILGLIFLAFIANYTIKLLSKCRKLTDNPEKSTYVHIGKETFGISGVILVNISVIALNLGICASYVDFIASNFSSVLVNVSNNEIFTPGLCILMVAPILLFLSMIRSYSFLLFTSVPGCLALLFAMIVSYGYFFSEYDIQPLSHYPLINFESFPLFFGNAAFLFCIHSVVLPIEQSMENKEYFARTVNVSMVFVTLLNLTFAVICYMLLGYCAQGTVTDNLPKGWLPTTVQLFLCVDILFTYTIFIIPLSEMVEKLLKIKKNSSWWRIKYITLRICLVAFTICFALLVPMFNAITNIVGGLSIFVGIILPPIFYIFLLRKKGFQISWQTYLLNGSVCVIGILAGIAVIISTIFMSEIEIGIQLATGEDPLDCNANEIYTYSPAWI